MGALKLGDLAADVNLAVSQGVIDGLMSVLMSSYGNHMSV